MVDLDLLNPSDQFNNNSSLSSAISVTITEKAALYASYMPYLKNGGIFVPTNKSYALGDEVCLLLSLMNLPEKIAIVGKVVWVTPAGAHGNKAQGIGVSFPNDEHGENAKYKIEELLGAALRSSRTTHTL